MVSRGLGFTVLFHEFETDLRNFDFLSISVTSDSQLSYVCYAYVETSYSLYQLCVTCDKY